MISEPVPTNLKDRIAALHQRNVSPPSQRAPSPASSLATTLNAPAPGSVAALRDKIAKFEKKGGVPVPRGSFGMGAPPSSENGQPRKRGEPYGNRIPSQVTGGSIRLASHTTGGAFPPSSMPNTSNSLNNRRFSMSQVEAEGNFDDMLPSSKVPAVDLSTTGMDAGAKKSNRTDEESPSQGQHPANSPEAICRPSVEKSTSPTPPSTTPSERVQEAPIVTQNLTELSRNTTELQNAQDKPNVNEEPAELMSTGVNHISVADSLKGRDCPPSQAPVSQPTTDAPQSPSPSDPAPASPVLVASPVLTSEPLAIEDSSPKAQATLQAQPAPPVSMDVAGQPAQTKSVSPPSVVESPTRDSAPQKSSSPVRAISPTRPHTTYEPEPDFDPFSYVANNPTKSTFSTTVHRKVVESPPRASTVVRVIPRAIEPLKVPQVVEAPPTPTGELSTLMQDAVTWEALLDGAPLPESTAADKVPEAEKDQSEAVMKKRADDTRVRKQSVRRKRSHGNNSAKKKVMGTTPEPPLPVPLPPVDPFIIPPPDPGPKRSIAKDLVPDETPMTSFPPSAFVNPEQHKLTPTVSRDPVTLSSKPASTKSAGGKHRYFSTLRRLSTFASGNSRPSTISRSTVKQRSVSSAEDSTIVITPSDDGDFGLKPPRDSEDKRPSSMYNVGRPHKSKSGGLFRPGSFADKIWRRTRTRSNASSGKSNLKLTSPSAVSLADPSVLPSLHALDPAGAESTDTPRQRPPKRSSSMASSLLSPPVITQPKNRTPPSSFTPPPQLPPIPSWAGGPLSGPKEATTTTTSTAPLLNLDFSGFSSFPSLDQRPETATTAAP